MDAREVTRLVKEYFEETNGPFGALMFQIASVTPRQDTDCWLVQCSFFCWPNEKERSHFEVTVRSDGSFERVEKIRPSVR